MLDAEERIARSPGETDLVMTIFIDLDRLDLINDDARFVEHLRTTASASTTHSAPSPRPSPRSRARPCSAARRESSSPHGLRQRLAHRQGADGRIGRPTTCACWRKRSAG